MQNDQRTLLSLFVDCARNPHHSWRPIVERGRDIWSYALLDRISDGVADELSNLAEDSDKPPVGGRH